MKPRWRITRTSCGCGGSWAWVTLRPSGAEEMRGCVCHHPWTLALRAHSDASTPPAVASSTGTKGDSR